MPDFTYETHQQCTAAKEIVVGKYVVHLGNNVEACTCPAFKFGKGKPCKHINQVKEQACFWHSMFGSLQSEEQNKNMVCPDCGGQTEYVRVAV